jgi:hypothetical protein
MSHALPFAGGIAVALVNIAVTGRLPAKKAAEFYNLFMAATAAVYVGSALAAGSRNTLALEIVLAILLFGLALAGQWISLRFTAAAFLAHGTWDLLHVSRGLGASAGSVFPVVCVAYDWVIAGYLWWLAPAKTD